MKFNEKKDLKTIANHTNIIIMIIYFFYAIYLCVLYENIEIDDS